jgi:hypothetical protein
MAREVVGGLVVATPLTMVNRERITASTGR